ncbi:nuclear RNA export factor 1-like [Galleria mellonella]|uniref:Nuclear RNA export factor 1-like n=1 Tax=Galleria mellonella TaxID=7137 RepID=A0ABM3MS62_GALME|nr:nuclear RNA export factor 1-like [Galleria mellonella]
MNTRKYQLDNYTKFLLTRNTATSALTNHIEICLSNEEDISKHYFHKFMVHNWSASARMLFDTMSEYYSTTLIPVNYTSQGDIASFYSSSLTFVLKIIKFNFMFPFQRNMYNVDILLNDKTSVQCFENRVSVEDIVSSVVSNRFNEKLELDLSNICSDPEFVERKICFYKIGLLNNFKILMIRMGRDAKILNLSYNNLSELPNDIMNFFTKGNLVAINLSYNNIMSLADIHRPSSKIEKIWLEGNPVCEDIDPEVYVKQLIVKFPRVTEIDGIKLYSHGFMYPFSRNYMMTNEKYSKMVVEKFLTLYYSHYDTCPRKIDSFYDKGAVLTISTSFNESEQQKLNACYKHYTRNVLDPEKRKLVLAYKKYYTKENAIYNALNSFPASTHDPATFCVDVPIHNKDMLMIVIDGIYREKDEKNFTSENTYLYFQFRRTFMFKILTNLNKQEYLITHDMFSISSATKEQIENSFKIPIRNMNILALTNPDPEEIETVSKAFSHLTQLKKEEAKLRLKANDWDFKKTLQIFMAELRADKISEDRFIMDGDDFSDISTLSDVD